MRYYFAPMEGLTDSVYRRLHHKYFGGIDRYYMPFISPTIHRALTHREDRELPVADSVDFAAVPQILTKVPEDFLWAAEQCRDRGYEEVNLNLGCPSGTVAAKGKGSGFLGHTEDLDRFLDEIFNKSPIEISIKTRLGVHDPDEFWPILDIYNQYPIKELTIHPRVQKDMYRNQVRMEHYLKSEQLSRAPLCYNGDLVTAEDCKVLIATHSEIDAVMLGRGLVANPALARQIKGQASATADELRAFHEEAYEGFAEMMKSRRNAMIRMKEIWYFHINMFEDAEKHIKQLRKATSPEEYEAAAAAIYRDLPLRSDAKAGWR